MKFFTALKTIALATTVVALTSMAAAAPVTFWYGGYIDYIRNDSNAIPISVTVGMPFTGRISYDPSECKGGSTNAVNGGSYSDNYFNTIAGVSSALQIGGHIITNALLPGNYCGYVQAGDNYFNRDVLQIDTAHSEIRVDGAAFVTYPRFSNITLDLSDSTKTAYTHAGIPHQAPDLANFKNNRNIRWGAYVDDGKPTVLFAVSGTITVISTNEIVILSQTQTGANSLRLSWPKFNTGFTLQSGTNLTGGTWINVTNAVTQTALENTVSVSTTGAPKLYRLKK